MNKSFIRKCCQACINTYKGQHGKVKQVFDNPIEFSKGDVSGHYAIEDDTLYIVYQGSHGRADWIDNFKFWKKDVRKVKPYGNADSDIEVHAGFMEQYKQIRPTIHGLMKIKKIKAVVCTGHSLGGALATLTAVDIQYNFPDKNITCVTFGSPRVGNKAFAESFNKRVPDSWRYVNGDDIVCKVPMAVLFYYHVDDLIEIGKKKFYKLFFWEDHEPETGYIKNI